MTRWIIGWIWLQSESFNLVILSASQKGVQNDIVAVQFNLTESNGRI